MGSDALRQPAMLHFVIPARRLVPVALLLGALACGGPRISRQSAGGVIQADPFFKSAKVVYLPRTIAIPAEGLGNSAAARQGEALSVTQMAAVDPVVAVLRARGQVSIEDFVSAVPSSVVLPPPPEADSAAGKDSTGKDTTKADSVKKDSVKAAFRRQEAYTSPPPVPPFAQAWVHTLRVTPRAELMTTDLAADDGEDSPDAPRQFGVINASRTPGWTITVGAREFVRVLAVLDYAGGPGQAKADASVDFLWRWKPTKIGAPFDVEGAEFQSLPREVQQAAHAGAITIDTSSPHWSRATLVHEATGWKVLGIDWTYGDDKPHDRW
jgi:hypothetical protein